MHGSEDSGGTSVFQLTDRNYFIFLYNFREREQLTILSQ